MPLDFYSGFVLEHRYQLSNQTVAGWLWHRVKGYAVGGVLGLLLVFGLYWILWVTGLWWWLAATAGWLAVTLVLGRLLPVVILPIFYKVTPLDNAELLDRARKLTQGTGLPIRGGNELHLSAETKKANAALAGRGSSRRVLLGETRRWPNSRRRKSKSCSPTRSAITSIAICPSRSSLSVVLSLAGFWLADRWLSVCAAWLHYRDITYPCALPLLLFVLAIFGLLFPPGLKVARSIL